MEEFDIWKVLADRSRQDPWYQTCLSMVQEREAEYLALRKTLPEAQQEILEDYLAACQELEDSLVLLAYQLGREQK